MAGTGEQTTETGQESEGRYSAELKAGQSFTLESDSAEKENKNIQNGLTALDRLITESKTSTHPQSLVVKDAMYREELGPIDFVWGTPGTGPSFKKGYGFSHIIEKRNSEGSDGEKVARDIVSVIANAVEGDVQLNNQVRDARRIRLHDNGYTVVLSQNGEENSWVLTGWENDEAGASASGEVRDSSGATAATPIRTRRSGGNASAFSASTVSDQQAEVKGKFSMDNPVEQTDRLIALQK